MKKADRLIEILDGCGEELFSALMAGGIQRGAGIDRTAELFYWLSDRTFLPKNTSAAYRLMAKRAAKLGWALGEPSDRYTLSGSELRHIEKKLRDYLASGGRKRKILKKAVSAAAVITIAGVGVFFTVRYVMSEEYLSRMAEYNVMIANDDRSEEEIVFSIRLRDIEDMYLERMPVLKRIDKDGEMTFTAKAKAEFGSDPTSPDERALCTGEARELILRCEDYDKGYTFIPGHYEVTFDFCRYAEGEKIHILEIVKEVDV